MKNSRVTKVSGLQNFLSKYLKASKIFENTQNFWNSQLSNQKSKSQFLENFALDTVIPRWQHLSVFPAGDL